MRKRLWKNVTNWLSLLIFTYWWRGGESPHLTRYWRLQTCDKSHRVTLSSLNSDFLRRQIIKHHHKSLPAIFVSEKICSSDKIVTLRPIIRPNSQPHGVRTPSSFDVWEFDCSKPNVLPRTSFELAQWIISSFSSAPDPSILTNWSTAVVGMSVPTILLPFCGPSAPSLSSNRILTTLGERGR